jgi:NAD(P)-dependent dehydrogenase (short-subunit alcohol dehydrogenase family)
MKTALVTHALHFGGPAAVDVLLQMGFRVIAHDASFAVEDAAQAYRAERGQVGTIANTDPQQLVAAVWENYGPIAVVVSNDAFPAIHTAVENAHHDDLRNTLEQLVIFPYLVMKYAIPRIKAQGRANILFITSCRMDLPLPGGAIPDMARAAANAMVVSLSIELAPFGIPVNAVAPNYLYSEAYFPAAFYKDNPVGKAFIEQVVPAGRLGHTAELSELIGYFAGMKGSFHTGSIVKFSGGWPAAPKRPF